MQCVSHMQSKSNALTAHIHSFPYHELAESHSEIDGTLYTLPLLSLLLIINRLLPSRRLSLQPTGSPFLHFSACVRVCRPVPRWCVARSPVWWTRSCWPSWPATLTGSAGRPPTTADSGAALCAAASCNCWGPITRADGRLVRTNIAGQTSDITLCCRGPITRADGRLVRTNIAGQTSDITLYCWGPITRADGRLVRTNIAGQTSDITLCCRGPITRADGRLVRTNIAGQTSDITLYCWGPITRADGRLVRTNIAGQTSDITPCCWDRSPEQTDGYLFNYYTYT